MKKKNFIADTKKTNSQNHGFTMVEVLLVLFVMGILAGISVVGYGSWRENIATKQIKSDLAAAASAMEDVRNFSTTGYPSEIPSSFKASEDVEILYIYGHSKSFCIEGRSNTNSSLYYFIDSTKGNEVQQGACAGSVEWSPEWTVFAYDTTQAGCTGRTVALPIHSPASATVSVIEWGDGSIEQLGSARQSHTYATDGEKIVAYKGPIATIDTSLISSGVSSCLKEVRQWGSGASPTAMSFKGSSNIQQVARPPVSVTNMASMFENAKVFNQDIGSWDVSRVTNMSSMFAGASSFNQSLSLWNTSVVTDMSSMFNGATVFNQDVYNWNTVWVANMSQMFKGAVAFNQPPNFETTRVTNMSGMFQGATSFNQNLAHLDTGNVVNFDNMFNGATSFNQNIGSWDVGTGNTMEYMFYNATSFNRNLSGWQVGAVVKKPPTGFNTGASAWVLAKPVWV